MQENWIVGEFKTDGQISHRFVQGENKTGQIQSYIQYYDNTVWLWTMSYLFFQPKRTNRR